MRKLKIVTYEEVEDWQMAELYFSCFEHTHSGERVRKRIEKDCRVPDWGGELYAVEGDKVLGTAALQFPRIKTTDGTMEIGGIRGVCTRPSESQRGVAEKLLKELHEIITGEGLKYSILLTWSHYVAYNLYLKLGYKDLFTPTVAYKKSENSESGIGLVREKDSEYIRSIYERNIEGLLGFTVRERDFLEAANAKGYPDVDDLGIFYERGERIGYALYKKGEYHLICNEVGAENTEDLKKILNFLESEAKGKHVVLDYINPKFKQILENLGFRFYKDRWKRIMIKNLERGSEGRNKLPLSEEDFHPGIYEAY